MALKRKLDKAAYDALSEEMKEQYKKVKDDYVLDVDGDDDNSELKRAKDREKQRADDLQKRLDDANAKLEDGENLTARKKGDIDALEKSWKEKTDKVAKDLNDKLASKDAFIRNQLVDNVARDIAGKISSSPALLVPHIKARLTADLDGDAPATKVLDAEGKPSAMTLDDLQKEFVANKDYSAIIIASKANGSGAATGGLAKPNGSATLKTQENNAEVDLTKAKPADLAAMLKSKAEAAA